MILHAFEAGQGNPPLVLLHGLFGAARNFGTVQRALAADQRTIAIDLRNHGASAHARDMRYASMADDLLQTLQARSATPAVLLGHSMGGKVAMLAALTCSDAVAGLIVADIAPVAYPPHYRAIGDALVALPLRPGLSRAAADSSILHAVPDAGMRAFLLQNLQLGAAPAWRIGLAEIIAGLPEIESWEAPTPDTRYCGPMLVIAGERSDYVRPAHRPLIRRLFPEARFVTLKNAGHWLHADNPTGFIAVVEAFLAAIR